MSGFSIEELFSVKDKVALITGGSRGIGKMIAEAYVENGMRVYISARKKEACLETAKELSVKGTCVGIAADMTSKEGRAALIQSLKEKETALDVLVNNAGASWGSKFDDYPENGYDKVMDINVKAPFFLTQELLPMLTNGATTDKPARVINVGSIDGLRVASTPNYAYGPSKAAIHHMTRNLAVTLGRRGVTVNAIAPGPFESKMTEQLLKMFEKEISQACPLKRIGSPEDMAGVALYLASKAGAYVNGAVIPVDGGIWLGGQI
ncbi:MAG: SDR family oxidoreductase [Calditrichia bacterium]